MQKNVFYIRERFVLKKVWKILIIFLDVHENNNSNDENNDADGDDDDDDDDDDEDEDGDDDDIAFHDREWGPP